MIKKQLQALTILASSMLLAATYPSFSQTNDDEKLVVEADDNLQWRREDQQYIATGNASAKRGDTELNADIIIADYEDKQIDNGESRSNITLIEGQNNAVFKRGGLVATGTNITYDFTKEYAVMTGENASVINGAEKLTASESIVYDRKNRLITAKGNAHVVLSNGQELKGNFIEARLNDGENDIETVLTRGNAQVLSPGSNGIREAVADTMTYNKATGEAVLTDNVILKDGGNVLKGDKAVIDTVSGTSTMSSSGSGNRVGGVFLPAQN